MMPSQVVSWGTCSDADQMNWVNVKGADLFLKGGQTKKQAGGRGTSRYSIGIKS